MKKAATDEISSSCKQLCKRSHSSVLYGNTYESLKEFEFDKVWNEMATNVPFLKNIFNSVSGKNGAIEISQDQLKVKYDFIYSILMNERWHELSLLKRVHTVLVIEGGCTKQVRIYFNCKYAN